MTSLAALLFLCVVAVTSGQMSVDLKTGATYGTFGSETGTLWIDKPPYVAGNTNCNSRGLLQVTFDRAKRQRLRITMTSTAYLQEFPFQFGDSKSNYNNVSDRGHQSNDAHVFFYLADIHVYARKNPATGTSYGRLHLNVGFVRNTIIMEVADGLLTFYSQQDYIYMKSDKLFALAGQPDAKAGQPNYDVFVSFNRMITSHFTVSTGLCSASFTWLS